MRHPFFSVLFALSILLASCAQQSANTSTPVSPTMAATETSLPTATAEPTVAPTATSVPGDVTIPLSSFDVGIPWLSNYDSSAAPTVALYGFNVENAPFDNALVRQAFVAALDREEMFELTLQLYRNNKFIDAFQLATTLTPPSILGRDLTGVVGIPFDPTKAKTLLEQAGYTDPEDFPRVVMAVGYAGDIAPGARERLAQAAINMWEENLGVTSIELVTVPSGYGDYINDSRPDIYMLAWAADFLDPDNFLNDLFGLSPNYGGEYNWSHYSSDEFNSLMEKAAQRGNTPEKRQHLYVEAERLLTETDAVIIPLFFYLATL